MRNRRPGFYFEICTLSSNLTFMDFSSSFAYGIGQRLCTEYFFCLWNQIISRQYSYDLLFISNQITLFSCPLFLLNFFGSLHYCLKWNEHYSSLKFVEIKVVCWRYILSVYGRHFYLQCYPSTHLFIHSLIFYLSFCFLADRIWMLYLTSWAEFRDLWWAMGLGKR